MTGKAKTGHFYLAGHRTFELGLDNDARKVGPQQAKKMRSTLGERFKILLLDAGLTPEQAGKELHVTSRTIRYWISGKVLVPYAAFRLLRILRLFELPGEGWAGWHMHSGRLWTPEGFSFEPHDANWWHLLVRRADGFGRQYTRANQLDVALHRLQGPDDVVAATSVASSAGTIGAAATSPTDASRAGGVADRPNLLIEHFRKLQGQKAGFSLESTPLRFAMQSIASVPHYENLTQGVQP